MPKNEYSSEEALGLLMKKLVERDRDLAAQIQAAIDAGKDIEESEPSANQRSGKAKKPRVFRKAVPFSHEEALQVALDALRAYFVEQPLFASSAVGDFTGAAVGVPQSVRLPGTGRDEETETVVPEHIGEEKAVVIELQTETQLTKTDEEAYPIKRVSAEQIDLQRRQLDALRNLVDPSGGQ